MSKNSEKEFGHRNGIPRFMREREERGRTAQDIVDFYDGLYDATPDSHPGAGTETPRLISNATTMSEGEDVRPVRQEKLQAKTVKEAAA